MPGPNADVKLSCLQLPTAAHGLSVSGGDAQLPCSGDVSVTPAGGASAADEPDVPLSSIGVSCEPRRAASAVGHSWGACSARRSGPTAGGSCRADSVNVRRISAAHCVSFVHCKDTQSTQGLPHHLETSLNGLESQL